MTAAQQKNLRERLQQAFAKKASALPGRYGNMPKMPTHVAYAARMEKKYERIVERWKQGLSMKYKRLRNTLDVDRESVETMILFGTPEQALAAVKKFEASK